MLFRKKKTKLDEIFALENQRGEQLEIPVVLDAATALPRYNKAEADLQAARLALSRDPGSKDATEAIGRAAISQLAVVFGEEGVEKLYAFFHGDAAAMVRNCTPYIKKRVIPVLKAGSKARRKELLKTSRRRK